MKRRVVYVEDDDVIRQNYTELLGEAGFDVTAFSEPSGVIDAIRAERPDLALLDVTLGDERDAGYELCAGIRRLDDSLPIVFLTSHDADIDKISGLRLGADDYLTKDVSFDYLIVRLQALLRRVHAIRGKDATESLRSVSTGKASATSLRLDTQRSQAYWKDNPLPITLTQYWILECLAAEPGRVRTTSELMRAAKIVVEPNTIVAHVKAIRDTMARLDADSNCIRTERGKGYRWVD
jgi:two-component system OmpR family response regulator